MASDLVKNRLIVKIRGLYVRPLVDMDFALDRKLEGTLGEWALLRKEITPNGWAIDAGAHIGYFSRKLVDLGLNVVAIEPEPNACRVLRRNVSRGVVIQAAVSNRDGESILNLSRHGTMNSMANSPYATKGSLSVKTVSLDSVAKQLRIEKIEFLKLDVEGWEYEAIEGASGLLAERRIRLIFVESHPFGRDPSRLIAEAGYVPIFVHSGPDAVRSLFRSPSDRRKDQP